MSAVTAEGVAPTVIFMDAPCVSHHVEVNPMAIWRIKTAFICMTI